MFEFLKKKLKGKPAADSPQKKRRRRKGKGNGGERRPDSPRKPDSARKPAPVKAARGAIKTSMNSGSGDSRVYFGALGGLGPRIGCNLYLYGTRGQWIIVDMGSGFTDESQAGADTVIPDISFLRAIKDRILGILITHSHIDHFAAIPHFWEELRCPVYGTPFALKMLEKELGEFNLLGKIKTREIDKNGARFQLGPFDVEYMHVTHSIPQANFIIIRTEQGALLHTGDFKFDPEPLIDSPTDFKKLEELGREGVLAVMPDSTNAIIDKPNRSEASARDALERTVRGIKSGKRVVTCFATNAVRVGSIYHVAKKLGLKLAVFGRSLETNIEISKSEGYLGDLDYITSEEAARLDDSEVLYLCTGTQGEPRSVMSRVAGGIYSNLRLSDGDTVVFSSRIIPGNEEAIFAVQNNLARRGINVISVLTDPDIHVSGHATRDELAKLYGLVKPRIVIPVHGEPMHTLANHNLARDCKVPHALIIENGQFVALEDGKEPRIVEVVPTAQVLIDGSRQVAAENGIFASRRKINYNGAVFVSVVIDKRGLKGKPEVSSIGAFEHDATGIVKSMIVREIAEAVSSLSKKDIANDAKVKDAASNAAKKVIRDHMDKKPPVSVHLARV
ncbi:MAG: ribonuclease J [Rickettsiales bacterium]|jgi:ribonuclease J|nr:ribonuclease J [Rickettsiales bacterium]